MKKQKIGAFVGKFYPPHIGHLSVVDKAVKELDKVYIIISKNDIRNEELKKEQNFEILSAELIKTWFEQHYKNNQKIVVDIFDETGLKPYPEDVDVWSEKFKKQFPEINVKIADAGYREFNKKYFPEYEFYEIDRDKLPIHSTNFRQNPKEYLQFLIPEARAYFAKENKLKIYLAGPFFNGNERENILKAKTFWLKKI